jgi:adenine-specific DNA glycosylase
MELGTTLAVRRRPLCPQCPLQRDCSARRSGLQHEIPAPRRGGVRRRRSVYMVVALQDSGEVLLERRPDSGVWGGLWCLPEFSTASAAGAFIRDSLHARHGPMRSLAPLEHASRTLTWQSRRSWCVAAKAAGGGGPRSGITSVHRRASDCRRDQTLLAGLAQASLFDADSSEEVDRPCHTRCSAWCSSAKPGLERIPYRGAWPAHLRGVSGSLGAVAETADHADQ